MTQIERWYGWLTDEEDARVCKDISDEACREVPGNFARLLLVQCFTKLADAMSQAKTVLPWLLTSLGAPAFFSALLVPIRESGSLLPQLVIGGWVRQARLRKGFFALGCLGQALAVLWILMAAFTSEGRHAGWHILMALVLLSLARGLSSVASKDVLGKTVPKTRRGRLNGLSASVAGGITLGLAALLFWQPRLFQSDIALGLLALAAIAWLSAGAVSLTIKETAGETRGGGNALLEAIANVRLLKTDVAFRRFVIVRALMMSSGLSAPFFVTQVPSDSAWGLTGFLAASGLAGFLSGPVWGRLADQNSRWLMIATALMTAIICAFGALATMLTERVPQLSFFALFFLLMVVHEGVRLGRKTYLVDLASGSKRTDYVAVSNTIIGILLLVVGLLSAVLAQWSVGLVLLVFTLLPLTAAAIARSLPEA